MTNKKVLTIIFSILLLGIIACGQVSIGVETPTPTADTVGDIVSATLTALPLDTTTIKNDRTPGSWPHSLGETLTKGKSFSPDFAGLLFRDEAGLWVVDKTGVSILLTEDGFATLSPSGNQILYYSDMDSGDDIFLKDLSSGETRQLTNTPSTYESPASWWPGRPNIIVFNYVPIDKTGMWYGYLGAYDLESGEYLILDGESGSWEKFALSPDGETIIYDKQGLPMIYRWGLGVEPFPQEEYGMDYERFYSPKFSPDGTKLAFTVSGGMLGESSEADPGAKLAVIVVDLEAKTTTTLHTFNSFGFRGGPEITWSPNGEWVTCVNPGEVLEDGLPMALWAVKADGSEEHYLGFSTGVIWNPDSSSFLYIQWPKLGVEGGTEKFMKVEIDTWTPSEIPEFSDLYLIDWVDL